MSTAEEVRKVTRGGGAAITALISGSMVLAGRLCGCAGRVLVWAWEQASTDTDATGAAQAKANKAARAKAEADKTDDVEDQDDAVVTAPPVRPVRRPAFESVGMLALGGMLAAGAVGTVSALIAPHLGLLAPWRPVIISAGGIGWMVAAWMVAPPPKLTDEDQEHEDQEDEANAADAAEDRGTALLWHVLRALADAESAGRAGLHLDVVLDSATAADLMPEDTEQAVFRAWLESCGLPTVDKLGMRIGGKPVTRVGLRVDGATEALGTTPLALVRARAESPAGEAVGSPAQPVGETPSGTSDQPPAAAPAEVPASAALRLIPGGRRTSSTHPSPAVSPEKVQEAR